MRLVRLLSDLPIYTPCRHLACKSNNNPPSFPLLLYTAAAAAAVYVCMYLYLPSPARRPLLLS